MAQVVSIEAARAARSGHLPAYLATPEIELYHQISRMRLPAGACKLLFHLVPHFGRGPVEMGFKSLAEGAGISRRTAIRSIDYLEDRKYIKVHRHRIGKMNATNCIEINFTAVMEAPVSILRTPRTKKWGSAKQRIEVVPKVSGTDNSLKEINIPKGMGRVAAPRFERAEDAIAASGKRVAERREAQARTVRPGNQLTLAGAKAVWQTVMLKHYPKVPAVVFSAREFAIFREKMKPILATVNLSTFFEFVIGDWKSLRETKFIWLRAKGKDIAIAPSLPELMRYFRIFAQAFSDREMNADQTHKLRRSMEEDHADKLAAEKAARAKADAENAKLRERLAKVERIAYGSGDDDWRRKPQESLTAARKRAEAAYNQPSDIPEWKSDDER